MAFVEFMCTYCGKKVVRPDDRGRPEPGKCPKRKREAVHRWVVNRKLGGK